MEQREKKHGGVLAVIVFSVVCMAVLALIFALYETAQKKKEFIDPVAGSAPVVEIRLDFDKISEEEQMLWDI